MTTKRTRKTPLAVPILTPDTHSKFKRYFKALSISLLLIYGFWFFKAVDEAVQFLRWMRGGEQADSYRNNKSGNK